MYLALFTWMEAFVALINIDLFREDYQNIGKSILV
jgi:hypothetical protein